MFRPRPQITRGQHGGPCEFAPATLPSMLDSPTCRAYSTLSAIHSNVCCRFYTPSACGHRAAVEIVRISASPGSFHPSSSSTRAGRTVRAHLFRAQSDSLKYVAAPLLSPVVAMESWRICFSGELSGLVHPVSPRLCVPPSTLRGFTLPITSC